MVPRLIHNIRVPSSADSKEQSNRASFLYTVALTPPSHSARLPAHSMGRDASLVQTAITKAQASVPVHGCSAIMVVAAMHGCGSLFRCYRRQEVSLQAERLAQPAIHLQPLVLNSHQLLQQPLQRCLNGGNAPQTHSTSATIYPCSQLALPTRRAFAHTQYPEVDR